MRLVSSFFLYVFITFHAYSCARRTLDAIPMKSASENKIVVDGDFVERRVKVALVGKTSGFIDDDQRVDCPVGSQYGLNVRPSRTYMIRYIGGTAGLQSWCKSSFEGWQLGQASNSSSNSFSESSITC